MNNLSKTNTARIVALSAVAIVAMLTFVGAGYAYTATYSDNFEQQDVTEEDFYVILQNSAQTTNQEALDVVYGNSTSDKNSSYSSGFQNVTFSDKKFVKHGTDTTVTTFTHTLSVKLVDKDGTTVSDDLSAKLTATAEASSFTGTNAVAGYSPAITFSSGVYTIVYTFTLVASNNIVGGVDYVIPEYTLKVVYTSS